MKMPGTIDPALLAPCGMNCLICYRHCDHKTPCAGCLHPDGAQPKHCQTCKIRACAGEQGVQRCSACERFPCGQLQALNRRYRRRYGVSLVENGRQAREQGIEAFLEAQRAAYTCLDCGGVISLYENVCSACRAKRETLDGEV